MSLSSVASTLPHNPHNELGAEKILCSRRQRSLGLSMLEAASYQCLRCHAGMEGKFPSRRSVWHILQVSLASIFFGLGLRQQHLTQILQIKTLRQRTIQTPLRYSLLAPPGDCPLADYHVQSFKILKTQLRERPHSTMSCFA